MTLVLLLTLLCLAVPVYVYFGYPAILWVLTRGLPDITHRRGEQKPSVALIISCYNEEGVIRQKLQNALELDYPPELLRIIVVSDGSDDGTDEAVNEFEDDRILLIRQEGRLGKTMGINLAMEQEKPTSPCSAMPTPCTPAMPSANWYAILQISMWVMWWAQPFIPTVTRVPAHVMKTSTGAMNWPLKRWNPACIPLWAETEPSTPFAPSCGSRCNSKTSTIS